MKLKTCLIGCGTIAREHARAYAELKDEVDVFAFDIDADKARELCEEFGFAGTFASLDEALSSPDVKAVDICLPHDLHLPVARMCADAGKHILMEKPIARTLQEADQVISAVRSAGVILMIAENMRFHPPVVEARKLIDKGAIGKLNMVQANSWQFHIPPGWRRSKERTGGGTLIDRGIHFLDIPLNLAGPVETVYALKPPQTVKEMEGEDGALVLMKHRNGVISEVNVTWGTPGAPQGPWFIACGTDGSIYEQNGLWIEKMGGEKSLIPTDPPDRAMFLEIEHFVRCVKEGREPIVTGEVGREDLALVIAAYKSMETGKPVEVSEL
ncbi:Gfo/Idh/MocA family oxidoreductase [Candidatus Poribacteria bacterium]|nr:Gfo/Idh/MocA family oxidoreductase [Candidatus Poribacteria bacterium]